MKLSDFILTRFHLPLVAAVVFFTAAGELFAQQPAQPAAPADTTAGTSPQLPPAEPSAPAKLPPGMTAKPSEFESQVGYNLKITVRMSPVYEDSTLTSGVIAYLPKGSVVGVLTEQDTWYKIEFGPEEQRQQGWVISYGVERTHELEHIVTNREDASRWEGQRVKVVTGETLIRSFPSTGADVLLRAYRNEIFNLAGEAEDYYMVELSNAVKGWVWRGDVEIYVEPKYSRSQVQEMIAAAKAQDKRLEQLQSLLADLNSRGQRVGQELDALQKLQEEALARAAHAARQQRKSFFQLDSLKNRLTLNAGFLRQGFGSDLGLANTMFKGLGLNYKPGERLSFEVNMFNGSPALRQPGSKQASLPSSLSGLDTLSVKGKFWQVEARVDIGGLRGVPILSRMDNYLTGGFGHLNLQSTAAGIVSNQSLWGAILGWGFGKRLFAKLHFDLGLRLFLTSTNVSDVRFQGMGLLESKKVFLINIGTAIGMNWQF